MKEKIKKYFGEILLVIGIYITTYNLFNFSYRRDCGVTLDLYECNNPVAYIYPNDTLIMLGIGFVLLVVGILIIRRK